ncbi:MAG: DNA-directed RNA polymerase subunit alpha [Chlamydiae bacterium SM23_39]|nr:MAG: DNA-directed RNA polymerase subunit alpha [Chlamydiae bacterium SM23_39]
MIIKYGKFEMPDNIKIEEEKDNFAKFIAEPFERGFGHTLGNAFRRIMLTSLEAPAIMSVKMEKIYHEYAAIEGIKEDIINIILNLKGSKLRYLPKEEEYERKIKKFSNVLDISQKQIDEANGMYSVSLKEFLGDIDFEIINPDHHIMTITSPIKKRIDFKIGFGRGYVPSEKIIEFIDKEIDEIILDVSYSPVTLVNYYVENTRVGQHTDYDRLILEVTTDGRITPSEALSFATQIAKKHFEIFDKIQKMNIEFEEEKKDKNRDRLELLDKLALKISEIELSVRSTNCLSGANITTIGELVLMPEIEMLKFRNFGKKSLTEIKEKLHDLGLSLDMNLEKYGISQDNIKSVIKKHLEEREV